MFSQSLNGIWSCYTIGYTIGWVCSIPYAKAPMLIFVIIPATILAKTSPTSVTNIDVAEFWNNPGTRLNVDFELNCNQSGNSIKYWIEIP